MASVAQLPECCPARPEVASSVPGQGTCLGHRPGPWVGAREGQLTDVSVSPWWFSPSLSPSLPLSTNEEIKSFQKFQKFHNIRMSTHAGPAGFLAEGRDAYASTDVISITALHIQMVKYQTASWPSCLHFSRILEVFLCDHTESES